MSILVFEWLDRKHLTLDSYHLPGGGHILIGHTSFPHYGSLGLFTISYYNL